MCLSDFTTIRCVENLQNPNNTKNFRTKRNLSTFVEYFIEYLARKVLKTKWGVKFIEFPL